MLLAVIVGAKMYFYEHSIGWKRLIHIAPSIFNLMNADVLLPQFMCV